MLKAKNQNFFIIFSLLVIFLYKTIAYSNPSDDNLEKNLQQRNIGEFKGTATISKNIYTRILDSEDQNTVKFDIKWLAGPTLATLSPLLGEYDLSPDSQFRGGEPNPFNTLVWHRLLDAFSVPLSEKCNNLANHQIIFIRAPTANRTFVLSSRIINLLSNFCNWNQLNNESRKQTLKEFWLNIMGYDAPQEEFNEWANLIYELDLPEKQRLYQASLLLLMNPYFLLQR